MADEEALPGSPVTSPDSSFPAGGAEFGCTLCSAERVPIFARAHGRTYLRCPVCDLTFLHPGDRPSPATARAHYATHQNAPRDERYRAFLSRIAVPLAEQLAPGAKGLDFGSGPGPTLSVMLEEMGFQMTLYDPLFAPDAGALLHTYDFVTCTETAEHFFDPAREFSRLDQLVVPGGWIALMTELVEGERSFGEWRYARDPTHASFYSPATIDWIANRFGWSLLSPRPNRNVILFRKAS